MRCPNCQKFVSLDFNDPEVDNLQVEYNEDADAPGFLVTGSVHLVRVCADCGQELKEATLEIEQELELGENVPEAAVATTIGKDLSNAYVDETPEVTPIESGGGRYEKSYFGATVQLDVRLGDVVIASVEWSDEVAASEMDEKV